MLGLYVLCDRYEQLTAAMAATCVCVCAFTYSPGSIFHTAGIDMNSTHVQYSSLYFTRSDKEGSPHFVELMAKEGDTTDQEEDSSQS